MNLRAIASMLTGFTPLLIHAQNHSIDTSLTSESLADIAKSTKNVIITTINLPVFTFLPKALQTTTATTTTKASSKTTIIPHKHLEELPSSIAPYPISVSNAFAEGNDEDPGSHPVPHSLSSSSSTDSNPAGGFIKTCYSNWKVWDANNVLWANCRARGRRGKYYWSRLGLDHMFGNVGGRLVYQKNGYFSSSCISCKRRAHTISYLACECLDSGGEYRTSSIDLSDYIGNLDGHLCSEYECGTREDPPPGGKRG
ncbi:hypothetical protein EsH8_III_001531 [Colletotrichum jinshuiense]